MRATAVRRTALAASAACLALLATACGGSDSGGKGDSAAPGAKDDAGTSAVKALTTAELEKVSLEQGDVDGYKISKTGPEDIVAPEAVTVDKKECQPIGFAFYGVKRGTPVGNSGRKAVEEPKKKKSAPGDLKDAMNGALDMTSSLVTLASYDGDGAEKNLAELRESAAKCATGGFTLTMKDTRQTITSLTEEKVAGGDEAVAWRVQMGKGESAVPFKLVSLRKGGTVATFFSFNLGATGEKSDFDKPTAVIDAQAGKLG
ncbi:hypothetical protein OG206_14955 [Streptomyces sp. NBC_01341]|uniref:hypothetical protein n=1 Tax=Streptomyces sp. NBC_01341 TaxID=2903831 RepID=UPI002E1558B8|nr:hypothetical protein OG206_14955 [Streptomyces sp. NBC_01341]